MRQAKIDPEQNALCCDFCGKNQREVLKLMFGPRSAICDECTLQAWDICREQVKGFFARAKDLAIGQAEIKYTTELKQINHDFEKLKTQGGFQ